MNDYLDRQDILDIASQYCTDDDGSCSKADVDLREMLDEIEALPSADVQPVIHAHWIRGEEKGFRTYNPLWYCSNCGGQIRYDTRMRQYQKIKRPVWEVNAFCRRCGAKMKQEAENDTL